MREGTSTGRHTSTSAHLLPHGGSAAVRRPRTQRRRMSAEAEVQPGLKTGLRKESRRVKGKARCVSK